MKVISEVHRNANNSSSNHNSNQNSFTISIAVLAAFLYLLIYLLNKYFFNIHQPNTRKTLVKQNTGEHSCLYGMYILKTEKL